MSFGSNLMKVPGNPLASIIGGVGTQFLGDYMAQKEDRKQSEENREAVEKANKFNYDMQKEFAQHSLRWRIEDAAAAGIHPLAALGAQSYQATPSAVGYEDRRDRGAVYRNLGQNISRAISSTRTSAEKAREALEIESMSLDNQLKKRRLEELNGSSFPAYESQSGIPMHLLGQNPISAYGKYPSVIEKPTERSRSATGKPHEAAGTYTDYVYVKTPTGLHPVPSKESQEAIEDKFIPETLFSIRNYLKPTFSRESMEAMRPSLKDHPLPPGYIWRWKPSSAEFQPYKKGTRSLKWFTKE